MEEMIGFKAEINAIIIWILMQSIHVSKLHFLSAKEQNCIEETTALGT